MFQVEFKNSRVRGDAREVLIADVVARYEAGETVREIANSLNRSYGMIHRALVQGGIDFRARGRRSGEAA